MAPQVVQGNYLVCIYQILILKQLQIFKISYIHKFH